MQQHRTNAVEESTYSQQLSSEQSPLGQAVGYDLKELPTADQAPDPSPQTDQGLSLLAFGFSPGYLPLANFLRPMKLTSVY